MKIRAILMDMDGTFLGRSQVATSMKNMEAIRKALDMGVHVIPCTGRVYDMLPPQLLTQPGIRYCITGHGARAYDCKNNTTLYSDLIPAEQVSQLMEILEDKGLYNEIAANATIYLEKAVADDLNMALVPEHHLWYIRDNCYTVAEKPSKYFKEHNIAVEKMNLYGIPEQMQQEVYDAITATGFIKHTRPGAGANLEFSHYTLNKLNAVDAVLKELGISYEETLAIGDSSTDAEIIKACGIGIAMGNAPEHIKAIADDVTDLNTNDGLAKALDKYVLNPGKKDFLVCIDSDGCAFDTMEIKHKECFCPSYINYFGLQAVSKYARDAWDFANLYSGFRGINRFLSLLKSLEVLKDRKEVLAREFVTPTLPELESYVAAGRPLNNAGIEAYLNEHPESKEFQNLLAWSVDVNQRIAEMVHSVPPFPYVRQRLKELSKFADIVIVSATPQEALEREWAEHDLLPLICEVKGQESGNKKQIIASLKDQYPQGHVLMIGDAPGDRDAAHANGALFYPICPDQESDSWEKFDQIMEAFLAGKYAGALEQEEISHFETLLPTQPAWATKE